MSELSELHLQMLRDESGISQEILDRRGYKTMSNPDALARLGFSPAQCRVPGLLIPILDANGDRATLQYRPDAPREGKNGKLVKYESLPQKPLRLDVPPTVQPALTDVSVPLLITEGTKKADAAASRGFACVSVAGVWGWRAKQGDQSVPIPDLDEVAWRGRTVFLAFDSDVVRKSEVKRALNALNAELAKRGAMVHSLTFPEPQPGTKVGLDDFLVAGGDLGALMEQARQTPKDDDSKAKESAATKLLNLLQSLGVELWHSADDSTAYATIQHRGFPRHLKVSSEEFDQYCQAEYYKHHRTALPSSGGRTSSALAIVVAEAKFEGQPHEVRSRIYRSRESLYLALGDPEGRIIRVTPSGWEVIKSTDCPVRFEVPAGAIPLPEPSRNGSLDRLRGLLNVEEQGFVLIRGFLLGYFMPVGTFPVLAVAGEQGSGKSLGTTFVRRVVDPVSSPLRSMPPTLDALAAIVQNNELPALDNISRITPAMSDALCGVVSGTGIASRELYTNAREHVVKVHRPLILNGIDDVVTRADLMSRTLLVRFQRLSDVTRRTESELRQRFEQEHPLILGGYWTWPFVPWRRLRTLRRRSPARFPALRTSHIG